MFEIREQQHTLLVRMSADMNNIDRSAMEVRRFLARKGKDSQRFAILIALREALSNAVVHGSGGDESKIVEFRLFLEEEIRLEVKDGGKGFDWKNTDRSHPRLGALGGRGLAVMGEYFQEMRFQGTGNHIVLAKPRTRDSGKSEISHQGEEAAVRPGRDIVSSMADDFRNELRAVIESGVTALTLDLDGVEMMDSIGMGLLIATHNALLKRDGSLRVVNASREVAGLLKTMRLDQYFSITSA